MEKRLRNSLKRIRGLIDEQKKGNNISWWNGV